MGILEILNHFANLISACVTSLLVILTSIYVVLTWRNLKELQRASSREHKLRHLADIKTLVSGPILEWLDSEALPKLRGGPPAQALIIMNSIPVRKQHTQVGDALYEYRDELGSSLSFSGTLGADLFNNDLFDDARRNHFPRQLDSVLNFVNESQKFAEEIVHFCKEWVNYIASRTTLPRRAAPGSELADPQVFVEVCVRCLLAGEPPNFRRTNPPPAPGVVEFVDSASPTRIVARGMSAQVLSWMNESKSYVESQWQENRMGKKGNLLIQEAATVRQACDALQLTYVLPGECEYVGIKSR